MKAFAFAVLRKMRNPQACVWTALLLGPVLAGAATFTVENTLDDGGGSLRQAILMANTNPGPDVIAFDIPGGGAQVIQPLTALPGITDPVRIDGTTQPGYAGVPLIELNGLLTTNLVGLSIQTSNSVVTGLAITRFSRTGATALILSGLGATGNWIHGNYIGLDANGANAAPNFHGIALNQGAHHNLIGTDGNGTNDLAERNIISGQIGIGILLLNSATNRVAGNFIGTDPTGSAAVGNNEGIYAFSMGTGNILGTDGSNDAFSSAERNVISGNSNRAVVLQGTHRLCGNYIGTDFTGAFAIPNSTGVQVSGHDNLVGSDGDGFHDAEERNVVSGNSVVGIAVREPGTRNTAIRGNYIGTDAGGTVALPNGYGLTISGQATNTLVRGNVISGNLIHGIEISDGSSVTWVAGNLIGTDRTGTAAVGNRFDGVAIYAPGNAIGGLATADRNVISGNQYDGVTIIGVDASSNQVLGNFIGTDVTGTNFMGNTNNGVSIIDSPGNSVGQAVAGAGNVISGNANGVALDGTNTVSNQVLGNFIGTDVTGTRSLGNTFAGVILDDAPRNLVGGASPAARNLISGNHGEGIGLVGTNCSDNVIAGNFIGTDKTGTAPLANNNGVTLYFAGGSNTVGLATSGGGNLISGNGAAGVAVLGPAPGGNLIQNNRIGTDVTGSLDLGNAQSGVYILNVPGNIVGGTTAIARNVVSGNGNEGVKIEGTGATNNRVLGNFLGTDASGTVALGNAFQGVWLGDAVNTIVGGAGPGARNLISGNGGNGVLIFGTNAAFNQILGNFIGTDVTGTLGLSNRVNGVRFQGGGSNNRVGGTLAGEGNTIAFNGGNGIFVGVGASRFNAFLGNSIFFNTGLGIDLAPNGPTANDPSDGDTGPNDLQNFPVLTSAVTGTNTVVSGSLPGPNNGPYLLQFFASLNPDPSGFGQGERLVGSSSLTTGGSSFSVALDQVVPTGEWITATATDPSGNTSEFSLARLVIPPPPLITEQPVGGAFECGSSFALSVTATGAGPLAYEWLVNFVSVPGEVNSTLTLTASPATAGNYSVVVSSPFGSVTSVVATVTVVDTTPPAFVAPVLGQLVFYDPIGFQPNPEDNPLPATSMAAGVTASSLSNITHGFLSGNNNDRRPVLMDAAPLDTTNSFYLTFTLTPPSGYGIDLTSLSYTYVSYVTGATGTISLRTSADGFATTVDSKPWFGGFSTAPGIALTFDASSVPVVNGPLEIRLYMHDRLGGLDFGQTGLPGDFPLPVDFADLLSTAGGGDGLRVQGAVVVASLVANTDPGLCAAVVNYATPTATDSCGTPSVVCTPASGSPFPLGVTTVTCTATDASMNTATNFFTVTVVDNQPPVITCTSNRVVECGTAWTFDAPSAIDICNGTNVAITIVGTVTNGLCGGTFAATRTWRATDNSSNSAECSQTVTVVDNTPPAITCASDAVVECGTAWNFTPPTATDICDGTNVTITIVGTVTNGLCGGTFAATRTWRATDSCTNSAECSQTVTVVDRTPPAITCASDAVVECGTAWNFTPPTATDICDGTNVTLTIVGTVTNGLCGSTFAATRTWRATDSCTNSAECSQTVTVVDRTPPAITCASDAVVECGTAWNFTPPTATDICDGTNVTITIVGTVTNGLCGSTFAATRTWRATDSCTNSAECSQTVTVVDRTPPAITCASDAVVECGTAWNFTPPTATDICDGTNVTITIVGTVTNGLCGSTFAATRTWRATDSCTNSAECSQTVTVVDRTPPAITCASDAVVECGTAWNFTPPTATDICDGTNVTLTIVGTVTNGLCGRTFAATRTWRATDSCTNSAECSQTVTVVDTTPPGISCASDAVVECGTAWNFTPPTATDICDGTNVTLTIEGTVTNALIGQTYAATRTWRATDSCTNFSLCSQTVTIVDTTPPAMACSTNITVECAGPPGTVVTFVITAGDICDTNILLVCTPSSGATFALGLTAVKCVATDDSGNTNSCSFTVRVQDTTPPTIACPANIIAAEFPHDGGTAVVTFAAPTTGDICDASLAVACVPPSGATFPVGYTTVLCTARDDSGNSNTCSFLIRVIPYRLSVNTVTTTSDSGPGSFREALLDANDAPGENLIVFNLPGAGPQNIHLLSPLPVLTSPVIIDGWSQPGFSGIPLVLLDGSAAGGADGLVIRAGDSTVRGLALNGFATAISLQTNGGNIIRGNFIGVGAAGTNVHGNSGDGIYINSASNLIGGTGANERNVIAANGGSGIHFDTTGAVSNLVVGNFIGTAADGTTPAGNGQDGVRFEHSAARNTVGGTGPGMGNTVAFNGRSGVGLDPTAGVGNAIRGNSIAANTGLGIDLGTDGVTANDPGDADLGPNRLQNFPVLSDARSDGGVTIIDGTLESIGSATYRLDFFLNDTNDPTGYGEGAVYIGSANVAVGASGSQAFSAAFALTATYLQFITATATDPANNTSEFSQRVQVRTPPVVEAEPVATNAPPGAPVTLCSQASGTPPIFYQWRLNGENIPGATNACYEIPAAQVADGGTYSVVIINVLGVRQTAQAPLTLPIASLPSADNFADAVVMTGTNGLVAWNNVSATSEPGEPKHAGKPGGKSVWYKWTPAKTGITTVGTRGSTFDTLLAVYEGSSVSNLVSVAYDEDRGGYFTSGVRFNAFKHRNYYIAIDGFGGAEGHFAFGWSHEKTKKMLPSLDAQPQSQTVASGGTARFTVLSDCICGEGHHQHDCEDWQPDECDEDDDGHLEHATHPHPDHKPPKLTYQWFLNGVAIPGADHPTLIISNVQPANLGTYTVQASTHYRTIESQDAILQINDSSFGVQQVQAMDKFLDAALAPVQFRLGNSGGSPGAAGGGFQPASLVRGYTGSQTFNSTNARSEITEPNICGVAGGASEWITIVMEESGTLFINTDGSTYDTVIGVFQRGATNSALQLLGCDNNSGRDLKDSSLSVPVEAGKTNFLMVDGVNGAGGVLKLNLSLVTPALLSSQGFTNRAHKLRVTTHASARFEIQASMDLVNWTTLLTTNTPTSIFDFIDAGSIDSPRRFYRTQMLP